MLESLPGEIILLIAECVEKKRHLLNLICTKKRFRSLLLPVLYRSVHIYEGNVVFFAPVLVRRAESAKAIRKIIFERWRSWQEYTFSWEEQINTSEYRDALSMFSTSDDERLAWKADLSAGVLDAWMGLCLVLVHKHIRHLYFKNTQSFCRGQEHPYMTRIVQRAAVLEKPFDEGPAFPQLELVRLFQDENRHLRFFMPADLLPFVRLPALRDLQAICWDKPLTNFNMRTADAQLHPSQLPLDGTSSVTSLLIISDVSAYGMKDLVASCARLETLIFLYPSFDLFEGVDVDASASYRFLAPAKQHLQYLHLDHRRYMQDPRYNRWFGSLAEFSHLRKPHIWLRNLLDIRGQSAVGTPLVEVLPASLEWLSVENCKKELLPVLASQLRNVVAVEASRLVTIVLEGPFYDRDVKETSRLEHVVAQVLHPLEKACGRKDVRLLISEYELRPSPKAPVFPMD